MAGSQVAAPRRKRSIRKVIALALGTPRREWRLLRRELAIKKYALEDQSIAPREALLYPIDMSPLLELPHGGLDADGVPFNRSNKGDTYYHPTSIAQFALAHWNAYLRTGDETHLRVFLTQARWLAAHETRLQNGSSVWPMAMPSAGYHLPAGWLSCLTQGNVASVLVRAYRLTGQDQYLVIARRAVHSFKVDILDGGVQAPVGLDGVFFEEVATYPAARILNGFLLAVFGLYDYVDVTGDAEVRALADKSIETLHALMSGYDLGYWSRYDLLYDKPANRFYHSLHVVLLQALARYTGCEHCEAVARRWRAYDRSWLCRMRYYFTSRTMRYQAGLRRRMTRKKAASADGRLQVCVPITGFPIAGGMRGVLFGIEKVMERDWHMQYFTRTVGPEPGGRDISCFEWPVRPFGRETTSPRQFPNVWFYMWAGRRALARYLRGRRVDLVLPQDGAFTAAFTARAARRANVPVVAMDHGNVPLIFNENYLRQRRDGFRSQPWPQRIVSNLRFAIYCRVLRQILRYATAHTPRFLVAGDEVEESYRKRLGVLPDRIIRYPYMVDVNRFTRMDVALPPQMRSRLHIPMNALVVTMINRLTPEKDLDTAIKGIAQAYAVLPEYVRARVRIVIAGSGPLRAHVESQLAERGLASVSTLFGEATPTEVAALLNASDVFLYTGNRGTNYSMAVLEAMAAGCAVVATTDVRSNARVLAEGRGYPVPPGVPDAVAGALVRALTHDDERRFAGASAQSYVAERHSAEAVRRCLHRATGWVSDIGSLTMTPAPAIPATGGWRGDH